MLKKSTPARSVSGDCTDTSNVSKFAVAISRRIVYAECKKGKNDKCGQEYPLMREAIGQLMTGCDFTDGVIPMVAVPYTDKSKELAERWSKLTQIKNLGIKFALICEDGNVCFV